MQRQSGHLPEDDFFHTEIRELWLESECVVAYLSSFAFNHGIGMSMTELSGFLPTSSPTHVIDTGVLETVFLFVLQLSTSN